MLIICVLLLDNGAVFSVILTRVVTFYFSLFELINTERIFKKGGDLYWWGVSGDAGDGDAAWGAGSSVPPGG